MSAREVLGRADDPEHAHRRPQLGQRGNRLDHRGAAAHVELHLVHRAGRLERDPARVERHRLADQPEERRLLIRSAVVFQPDQPG